MMQFSKVQDMKTKEGHNRKENKSKTLTAKSERVEQHRPIIARHLVILRTKSYTFGTRPAAGFP